MAKTFDELHNERFGYNAASCTGYCANESKYSNYQYRREGYFLREAEVADLQAKLLEAQVACAIKDKALKKFGEHTQECKVWPVNRGGSAYDADCEEDCNCGLGRAIAKNPGAPLLARLEAADELAEASAQILRACASSFPRVFSNAQFILGEKLQAYKAS